MAAKFRASWVIIGLILLAGESWAATISGHVADYNAAQVRNTGGVLVVPANVATYTASTTVTVGSSFVVTLPSGFTFGTVPTLTTTGASTFTLASGGLGAQSATFTVATANLNASQSISLASFSVVGATALQTVTPVASALPLTMQVIGTDLAALSFRAFASDVGASAVYVGAIQIIDSAPPSNGSKFLGSPDTLTAVILAIAISPQVADAVTTSTPILGANGLTNSLAGGDTATVTISGNFGGVAQAFSSLNSSCLTPLTVGSVNFGNISIPNVPINTEVFFCLTGSGSPIQPNPNGFPTLTVTPGSSTDFLSAATINEFSGQICFSTGCAPFTATVPTLSGWAMLALAGTMLLLGIWLLRARPSPDGISR